MNDPFPTRSLSSLVRAITSALSALIYFNKSERALFGARRTPASTGGNWCRTSGHFLLWILGYRQTMRTQQAYGRFSKIGGTTRCGFAPRAVSLGGVSRGADTWRSN